MSISIEQIDYNDDKQARELVFLLNSYARDPMGGGEALPTRVQESLPGELAKLPYALSFIARVDGQPAGLANCFFGFSTFACKPLINIHDLVVLQEFRGNGLSKKLLNAVQQHASECRCCKVTLEVLANNTIAKKAYETFGFKQYQLDEAAGGAIFMELKL